MTQRRLVVIGCGDLRPSPGAIGATTDHLAP